jgi:hypothetical protein
MRAAAWSNAGQTLGPLDAQTPALADAVVALRGEWSAIQAESLERARESRR